MSAITPELVKKIARLARLGLTDAEVADAAQKLDDILTHFSTIQNIDTTGVPEASDMSGLKNIARVDTVASELCTTEELLKLAPATDRHHIKVRSVF